MNLVAQIPTNPYKCLDNCGNRIFTIFSVDITNECGVRLNGYPFIVKSNVSGQTMAYANGNTQTNGGLPVTHCCAAGIWGWKAVQAYGMTDYYIMPGYANVIFRGTNFLTCCTVDTMPGYSPDPSVGLGFSTSSPAYSTHTGGFTTPLKYYFTITNPYGPSYTVQGKQLDMNRPSANPFVISKCGSANNQIPLVNNTNTFGTAVQYKLTIYNSDINKTIGSVFYPGSWSSTLPVNYLDQVTPNIMFTAVSNNYYVIELAVRSSCSTGSGSYVRGHFKYIIPSAPTAGFKINNENAPTACTTPLEIYDCPSYTSTLSNASSIDAIQYNIELQKSSTTSCGIYTQVYNSGYLTTFPTDLKNLPGTNGNYIQTNPGFYKIILTVKNDCGTASTPLVGYFNIASPPSSRTVTIITKATTKPAETITIGSCTVPSNTQYRYIDGTSTCNPTNGYNFPMEHTNVSNANAIGVQSTTEITVGTGSSNYNVEFLVDRWTGISWQSMNYVSGAGDIINGATGTTTQILSYLPEDNTNNPNYDAILNATQGTIFKITTKVRNACGTYSNTQIIKKNTDNLKRIANPNTLDIPNDMNNYSVYPNPFSDKLSIVLVSLKDEQYKNIELIDITGKIVLSKSITTENLLEIDTHTLANGLYNYIIYTTKDVITGKVIKQ